MYHAVKITQDNILPIIKWIPNEQLREEFRDCIGYQTPGLVYYAVLEFHENGDARSILMAREDVVMLVPSTDLSIITLES